MPVFDPYHQIRNSVLGDGLTDEHIEMLAGLTTPEHCPAGTVIFKEASSADDLSVVCSGSVALDMHVLVRGNIRILTLGSGDLLGWSALVGDGVMTATATALKDTALLNIPGAALRGICDDDPSLGYAVMNLVAIALARRLHGTRLQMLDLFHETGAAPSTVSGTVTHD